MNETTPAPDASATPAGMLGISHPVSRVCEGDRVVSLDREDGGLTGRVLYVGAGNLDGHIEVAWEDGGKGWCTAKGVAVLPEPNESELAIAAELVEFTANGDHAAAVKRIAGALAFARGSR